METNFRATFAGVSIVLSSCVDEQNTVSDTEIDHMAGLQIDYLGAECNDIVFALQVNFASMLYPNPFAKSLPMASCLL